MLYAVNDFYLTVQGEGCQTGVPAVFLRLQGCPVGCPFCDTKETWEADPAHAVELIDEIRGAHPKWGLFAAEDVADACHRVRDGATWIVVTGGEPAMQPLGPLVRHLKRRHFKVAIETSGTAIGHLQAGFDWVCVSPKIGMPGGRAIERDAIASADEIKFVVGKQGDIDRLLDLLSRYETKRSVTVCLQPMSMSEKATAICVHACQQYGWRLSIQTHRLIGLA